MFLGKIEAIYLNACYKLASFEILVVLNTVSKPTFSTMVAISLRAKYSY
jgi:hypothetical protein